MKKEIKEEIAVPESEKESEKEELKVEKIEENKPSSIDIAEDVKNFHELFPEVTNELIPKEVWDLVEKGNMLSCAYALYFVKEEKKKAEIEELNKKNDASAPPKITDDGEGNDYFSPEAVKKMSRKEIKKNYDLILNSMDKWN